MGKLRRLKSGGAFPSGPGAQTAKGAPPPDRHQADPASAPPPLLSLANLLLEEPWLTAVLPVGPPPKYFTISLAPHQSQRLSKGGTDVWGPVVGSPA